MDGKTYFRAFVKPSRDLRERAKVFESQEEAERWIEFEIEKTRTLGKRMEKGDRSHIPISDDEREEIREHLQLNYTVKHIAKIMNRGIYGLYNEIKMGGGVKVYSPEMARKSRRLLQAVQYRGKASAQVGDLDRIEQKIDMLQEQLKILCEFLTTKES